MAEAEFSTDDGSKAAEESDDASQLDAVNEAHAVDDCMHSILLTVCLQVHAQMTRIG